MALICATTQVDYPDDAFLATQSGGNRDFLKRDSSSRQFAYYFLSGVKCEMDSLLARWRFLWNESGSLAQMRRQID